MVDRSVYEKCRRGRNLGGTSVNGLMYGMEDGGGMGACLGYRRRSFTVHTVYSRVLTIRTCVELVGAGKNVVIVCCTQDSAC